MCFKALIELVGLGVIRVGLGLIYGVVRATVHMLYKYIIDELTGPSEPRSGSVRWGSANTTACLRVPVC